MDLSKLSSNDKLALYGAVAAIVGSIVSQIASIYGAGGLWLSTILALAMIAIIFLPQWSPTTTLPGSKGSLMLIVGGVAALGGVFGLIGGLTWLSFGGGLFAIGILVGAAGSLLMGWAGWQAFQSEGGKFNVGMTSGSTAPSAPPAPPASTYTPPPAPPASTYTPPPPAAPMQEPTAGDTGHEDEHQG